MTTLDNSNNNIIIVPTSPITTITTNHNNNKKSIHHSINNNSKQKKTKNKSLIHLFRKLFKKKDHSRQNTICTISSSSTYTQTTPTLTKIELNESNSHNISSKLMNKRRISSPSCNNIDISIIKRPTTRNIYNHPQSIDSYSILKNPNGNEKSSTNKMNMEDYNNFSHYHQYVNSKPRSIIKKYKSASSLRQFFSNKRKSDKDTNRCKSSYLSSSSSSSLSSSSKLRQDKSNSFEYELTCHQLASVMNTLGISVTLHENEDNNLYSPLSSYSPTLPLARPSILDGSMFIPPPTSSSTLSEKSTHEPPKTYSPTISPVVDESTPIVKNKSRQVHHFSQSHFKQSKSSYCTLTHHSIQTANNTTKEKRLSTAIRLSLASVLSRNSTSSSSPKSINKKESELRNFESSKYPHQHQQPQSKQKQSDKKKELKKNNEKSRFLSSNNNKFILQEEVKSLNVEGNTSDSDSQITKTGRFTVIRSRKGSSLKKKREFCVVENEAHFTLDDKQNVFSPQPDENRILVKTHHENGSTIQHQAVSNYTVDSYHVFTNSTNHQYFGDQGQSIYQSGGEAQLPQSSFAPKEHDNASFLVTARPSQDEELIISRPNYDKIFVSNDTSSSYKSNSVPCIPSSYIHNTHFQQKQQETNEYHSIPSVNVTMNDARHLQNKVYQQEKSTSSITTSSGNITHQEEEAGQHLGNSGSEDCTQMEEEKFSYSSSTFLSKSSFSYHNTAPSLLKTTSSYVSLRSLLVNNSHNTNSTVANFNSSVVQGSNSGHADDSSSSSLSYLQQAHQQQQEGGFQYLSLCRDDSDSVKNIATTVTTRSGRTFTLERTLSRKNTLTSTIGSSSCGAGGVTSVCDHFSSHTIMNTQSYPLPPPSSSSLPSTTQSYDNNTSHDGQNASTHETKTKTIKPDLNDIAGNSLGLVEDQHQMLNDDLESTVHHHFIPQQGPMEIGRFVIEHS